jgi:polygalacturonase
MLSRICRSISVACSLAALCCAAAQAQDTRVVKEPVIPPACTVLRAQLTATRGVFSHGDADETKLDTTRIQDAMDKCKKGHSVELAPSGAKNAFLSGPVQLREGVILKIDKGVTFYGSRDPHVYETSPNSCGKTDREPRPGCHNLITATNVAHTGVEGSGTIDGRANMTILGGTKTWWQIARAPSGVRQQVPMLITTDHADDFTIYNITMKNSAHFHLVPHASNGITVWGLKINTPLSPNTDGFDPGGGSTNITIEHSYIQDGDDNIAIKGGEGGVTNMSVLHNHFYYGHGMSIGSETNGGVSNLLVEDLSLSGTDAGIRIKSNPSRGGLVKHAVYKDICIRHSRNPIFLTAHYLWPGTATNLLPDYRDIEFHNVRISGGGTIIMDGEDATHRIGVVLDGVMITDDVSKVKFNDFTHTDVKLGPGPVNIVFPEAKDSTITGTAGKGNLASCDTKFVPFPDED